MHFLSSTTGTILTKLENLGPIFSKFLIHNNMLFVVTMNKHCYIYKIDENISYNVSLLSDVSLNFSNILDPVALENSDCHSNQTVESNILLCSNSGEMYILNCNSSGNFSSKLKIIHKLEKDCYSSPKIAENKVVIGCRDNHVYCLELKSV